MADDAIWTEEERLWTGDGSVYADRMTDDCVMHFPLPTGKLDAGGVRERIDTMPRWQTVEFSDKVVKTEGDLTILTYKATANRGEDRIEPYHALVVTIWRGGKDGQILFHQQTPQLRS